MAEGYFNSAERLLQLRSRRGMHMLAGDRYVSVASFLRGVMAGNASVLESWRFFAHEHMGTNFVVAADVEVLRPMGDDLMLEISAGRGTYEQNLEAISRLLEIVEAYVAAETNGELHGIVEKARLRSEGAGTPEV